jgi:hypothetical protein
MAVDPLLFEQRLEMVIRGSHAFGSAHKQDAVVAQREMKEREDLFLKLRADIDKNIAAADEVEARKRCIAQQIMDREDDRRAQIARHAITVMLLDEEAF